MNEGGVLPSEQSGTVNEGGVLPSEQSGTVNEGGVLPSEQSSTVNEGGVLPSEQSGTVNEGGVRPFGTAAVGAARVLGATARGFALDAAAGAARAAEAVADAAGDTRSGRSTLRIRVLILSDEQGRPLTTAGLLRPALELADRVLTEQAGIRVRCLGVDTATRGAPTRALDPRANQALLLDDVLGRTAFYREQLPPRAPLAVVGDPVTVVVVRTIRGRITGCSLGMTADWVIVQASLFDPSRPDCYDETVLAHELGHALNLPHLRDPANLMFPSSSPPDGLRGTRLRRWQAALLHANRHTVPPSRVTRARNEPPGDGTNAGRSDGDSSGQDRRGRAAGPG